ncbi:uncharacterized protein Tco_0659317 [Tanacetum coccineum]
MHLMEGMTSHGKGVVMNEMWMIMSLRKLLERSLLVIVERGRGIIAVRTTCEFPPLSGDGKNEKRTRRIVDANRYTCSRLKYDGEGIESCMQHVENVSTLKINNSEDLACSDVTAISTNPSDKQDDEIQRKDSNNTRASSSSLKIVSLGGVTVEEELNIIKESINTTSNTSRKNNLSLFSSILNDDNTLKSKTTFRYIIPSSSYFEAVIQRSSVEEVNGSKGMDDVLENGPWMIRTIPIILNKWTPSSRLKKEDLTSVLVWIKFHDVHMAVFTADGNSFARAMIEIVTNTEMKDSMVVAIPNLEGEGYTRETISIEYEWTPPRRNTTRNGDVNCTFQPKSRFVYRHDTNSKPPSPKTSGNNDSNDVKGKNIVTEQKDSVGIQIDSDKKDVIHVYDEIGTFFMAAKTSTWTEGDDTHIDSSHITNDPKVGED